jgi:hypothetical protein
MQVLPVLEVFEEPYAAKPIPASRVSTRASNTKLGANRIRSIV